ncbi:hypothetical protein LR48_Vigan03g199700 [Vigna angularis]|uniref:Uncharacterized protein n=1 Tax=Phaseolus angularis TaxID=3914 RepID=A0A0L9U746_PHAAN|nr:hypothetical protein LR48_Vigan03g199700 [Vigna angularis]
MFSIPENTAVWFCSLHKSPPSPLRYVVDWAGLRSRCGGLCSQAVSRRGGLRSQAVSRQQSSWGKGGKHSAFLFMRRCGEDGGATLGHGWQLKEFTIEAHGCACEEEKNSSASMKSDVKEGADGGGHACNDCWRDCWRNVILLPIAALHRRCSPPSLPSTAAALHRRCPPPPLLSITALHHSFAIRNISLTNLRIAEKLSMIPYDFNY